MELKVSLRQGGSTDDYTLKPSREYIVSREEDHCNILVGLIAPGHIGFRYEHDGDRWFIDNLAVDKVVLINGQPSTSYAITSETNIKLDNNTVLVASPATFVHSSSSVGLRSGDRKLTREYPLVDLGWKRFKISSPEDGVGLRLNQFNLHQTYSVESSKIDVVCDKLYERVYQAVNGGVLGDAKARFLRFRKKNISSEDSRTYILVVRETIHGNRTTAFIRFFGYGDNLYLGFDVYTLGDLEWWGLRGMLARVILTAILLIGFFTIFPLFIIVIIWWKLLWRTFYEGNLGLAFRQEFPGAIGGGPFDYDDVIMFAKSAAHLSVTKIRDVFEEEGLPVDSLDSFIQNINNVSIGGSINASGSVVIGNKNFTK
jgi:hypothetical protein